MNQIRSSSCVVLDVIHPSCSSAATVRTVRSVVFFFKDLTYLQISPVVIIQCRLLTAGENKHGQPGQRRDPDVSHLLNIYGEEASNQARLEGTSDLLHTLYCYSCTHAVHILVKYTAVTVNCYYR